jgi:hypothetical protein
MVPQALAMPTPLVELLDHAFDVVWGFQGGVAVQDELHVRVELPRLTLEGGGLADGFLAVDGDQLHPVQPAEGLGILDRVVGAAVVDQDDALGANGLLGQGGQAEGDVGFFVEGGDHHVHRGLPPVFCRGRDGPVRSVDKAEDAEDGVRTQDKIRGRCHDGPYLLPLPWPKRRAVQLVTRALCKGPTVHPSFIQSEAVYSLHARSGRPRSAPVSSEVGILSVSAVFPDSAAGGACPRIAPRRPPSRV